MSEMFYSLKPLSERIRPQKIEDLASLSTLSEKQLSLLTQKKIPSIILYGPPGSGKTTIARCLQNKGYRFAEFQAVTTGVKEFREEMLKGDYINPIMVFIDEIHRLTKAQQDLFLPFVESGAVILIGATTESPYYHLNQALLSRVRIIKLESWTPEKMISLVPIIQKEIDYEITESITEKALQFSAGDLRRFIYFFENPTLEDVPLISQDQRHNMISAFIKCMRFSDVDAALFYGFSLLERGEDPLYLIRRMIIFASEDIGNMDPNAAILAHSICESVKQVGMPEGRILISQLIVYLAEAAKSRYSYNKLRQTEDIIKNHLVFTVPEHLQLVGKFEIRTDNLNEDIRKEYK